MKLAIIADIHANLEALEAVLIKSEKEKVDRFICLGDIVGYGVDPVACIYRLREVEAACVLGNHDQAMVDPRHLRTLNHMARESILHSKECLSTSELDFLSSHPFRRVEFGAVFSHANPVKPEEWDHLFLYDQVVWCMDRLDWRIGFVGHTHHPGIYCKTDGHTISLTSPKVAIGSHKYLVNPGSVGQPRNGDERASFAIWDVDLECVYLHAVEYPVKVTQQKLYEAGGLSYLAERLEKGE
jgi:predicted phosphodiesterase